MKFPWHSDKGKTAKGNAGGSYSSETVVQSQAVPGVTLTIAKMSFGRRVDLMRRVRELARRTEFLTASEDSGDKMDAALLRAEIERVYVMWGVKAISGLAVDARYAGVELLAEAGPEALFREALAAVRRETGLSEEERKNS
ncbi:MAG: hypothetical protein NTW28_37785 [Candidatus Solibacter sp.]|nr:hypothetical protein [Candidatus Solibacter sp.]